MTRHSQWTDHYRDRLEAASSEQVRVAADRVLSMLGDVADEEPDLLGPLVDDLGEVLRRIGVLP